MSKLYTEEQVIELTKAAYAAGENHNKFIFKMELDKLTPIQLPTDEERDKKFMDFLQKEHELGISDKATVERIEWYYDTYFTIDKIKGGQE